MEPLSPNLFEIDIDKPLFRDTLEGQNSERIDHITFTGPQPQVSEVLGLIMSYLKQHPQFDKLQFQVLYVDGDKDRITSGDFDTVNSVVEHTSGPYTRLNWRAIGERDNGGSAIFMYESGREPTELQLITASKQPTIDSSELLSLFTPANHA